MKNALLYLLLAGFILLVFTYRNRNRIKNLFYLSFFSSETYSDEKYDRNLNYRFFAPKADQNKKYPLLLYLHPSGDNGTDNRKQINSLVFEWADRKSQSEFPCFIFAPQCPEGMEWVDKGPMSPPFVHYLQDAYPERDEMKMMVEVISELARTYPVDTNRIYVVGFSMGATGCWDLLTRHPDLFAASIIASGVSDTSKARTLINTPVWAFGGEFDIIAPAKLNETMTDLINQHGGDAKFTLLKGESHGIGLKTFQYPGAREWLFNQQKPNRGSGF